MHTEASVQPGDSSDTEVHTEASVQPGDISDTEVHTEASVQPGDSRSCNVSSDAHVTLLLNCAALSDSSVHDMTATCLRQTLVSQHIRALLSAARSVPQMLFDMTISHHIQSFPFPIVDLIAIISLIGLHMLSSGFMCQ